MGSLREWLETLSALDRERLLRELRVGRIVPGDTAAMLNSLNVDGAWAVPLASLKAVGWTRETLIEALELSTPTNAGPGIQLVSTQPGASAVAIDTSVVLRRLFLQARHSVLLAGFRVTDRRLLEHLRRRDAHRLDVRLFLHLRRGQNAWGFERGPKDADFDDTPGGCFQQFIRRIWPEGLRPPRAWYAPEIFEATNYANMHVKAVVVDTREVFISSANFTQAAQTRNVELGVSFSDETVAEGIAAHFDGLVRATTFVPLGM